MLSKISSLPLNCSQKDPLGSAAASRTNLQCQLTKKWKSNCENKTIKVVGIFECSNRSGVSFLKKHISIWLSQCISNLWNCSDWSYDLLLCFSFSFCHHAQSNSQCPYFNAGYVISFCHSILAAFEISTGLETVQRERD